MTTSKVGAGLGERAALYETLAELFRPPTDATIARLASAAENLSASVDGQLAGLLEELSERAREQGLDGLLKEHARLFVGAGMCRANEVDYEPLSFSMTEKLADVAGFYEAWGYEITPGIGQRGDFAGIELEFIGLLLLKRAYAEESGWQDKAEIAADAARAFISAHASNWMPLLCDRIASLTTEDEIFRAGGNLIRAFMESEAALVGVEKEE
ncbi:MAG: molecular chaperone TorD family protein [Chloroflexi bacterium]|nr:molecular chaperone TorD family protein [Chloroflexota bacterium]